MKKKIYPKIIVDAGVTEEDIIQFEYGESDLEKLASIIEYEEKLSNSPLIAHHKKEKNDTTGSEYKFSEICENEASILSQFERDKAKIHTTLCILKIREELYDSNSILIASAAAEAGATACNLSSDLVMLNLARTLMIKALAYNQLYSVILKKNIRLNQCML